MMMKLSFRPLALVAAGLLLAGAAVAEPKRPECIAPASPGGGFDLTCKLAQSALVEAKLLSKPMRVTYMPGGVGAVAYNAVVAQRPGDAGTITAFSSGSLLNLAQGKFGRFDENAVKWLAAIGTSYGAIAVRTDSPYKNLDDLVKALKADPSKVVIGSGGTVGSQDWMQTALIAKAAGINPRDLRYVALEGGGEIATALLGGHIQVGSTDISDSMPHILSGDMRLLAVFSEERLPEAAMANIPTAKEQGYDIVWPVVRGFYLGPKVSDEDYAWWKNAFDQLLASEDFAKLRDQRELFPFAMTGEELDGSVTLLFHNYKQVPSYLAVSLYPSPPAAGPRPRHEDSPMTRSNLYQRLFAGLWLLACVGLAVAGWRYQAPFSYEPVGPRAYPLLCLALMGAGLAWLIVRPTPIRHAEDEQPLSGAVLLKVLACIALLLVFAGLFEALGFILSAALVGSCMAILYGARPLPAVITASLLGIGLYWLFDRALDVPLPLGVLDFLPL